MLKKLSLQKKGFFLTFLGATCWGLSGVVGEYLLNISKIDSIWVISNRLFYSGLFIILLMYANKKQEVFKVFTNKKDILKLLNFSFLGIAICQGAYFLAIKYTNAGTATILQYLGPTIIMSYFCIVKRKFPTSFEVVAILLSLIGTFVIATHLNLSSLMISIEGLIWGILSAVGLATYNILSLSLISKYGTMIIIGWSMLISGLTFQIITNGFVVPENFSLIDLLCFLIVILVGTIVSFTVYLKGVQLIGAVKGSIIACFEPIAAIIFSMVFIGTKFTLLDFIGSILIISAVIILNRR